MRKIAAIILSVALMCSIVACGETNSEVENNNVTVTNTPIANKDSETNKDTETNNTENTEKKDNTEITDNKEEKFELPYTSAMTAMGYETLVLEKAPERVACLTTSPVFALYEIGVPLIAVPSSSTTKSLAEEGITILPSLSHDDFDIEAVVALEPDLVIMSASYADSHGATLDSLNIPVYYMAAGHGVSYETVKEETTCLVEGFSVDEETTANGAALLAEFSALEERLANLQSTYSDKSVLVLQSGSATMHYVQTSAGTLGSMAAMMGFSNVYDTDASSSFFPLDMEQALSYHPDLILCVGAGTSDVHKALMEEAYASNPDYWNAIEAVEQGEVLYFGTEYIAATGTLMVDRINELIDIIDAHYAE